MSDEIDGPLKNCGSVMKLHEGGRSCVVFFESQLLLLMVQRSGVHQLIW